MSTRFIAFEIPIPIARCPELVKRGFARDKKWRMSEQFYEEGAIVYEYYINWAVGCKYLDVQFRPIDTTCTMVRATAADQSVIDFSGGLDKTIVAFKNLVIEEVKIEAQGSSISNKPSSPQEVGVGTPRVTATLVCALDDPSNPRQASIMCSNNCGRYVCTAHAVERKGPGSPMVCLVCAKALGILPTNHTLHK